MIQEQLWCRFLVNEVDGSIEHAVQKLIKIVDWIKDVIKNKIWLALQPKNSYIKRTHDYESLFDRISSFASAPCKRTSWKNYLG